MKETKIYDFTLYANSNENRLARKVNWAAYHADVSNIDSFLDCTIFVYRFIKLAWHMAHQKDILMM